jgi:hypothetical protein
MVNCWGYIMAFFYINGRIHEEKNYYFRKLSFKNYFGHDILGADFMSSVLFASYVSNSMQNTLA